MHNSLNAACQPAKKYGYNRSKEEVMPAGASLRLNLSSCKRLYSGCNTYKYLTPIYHVRSASCVKFMAIMRMGLGYYYGWQGKADVGVRPCLSEWSLACAQWSKQPATQNASQSFSQVASHPFSQLLTYLTSESTKQSPTHLTSQAESYSTMHLSIHPFSQSVNKLLTQSTSQLTNHPSSWPVWHPTRPCYQPTNPQPVTYSDSRPCSSCAPSQSRSQLAR